MSDRNKKIFLLICITVPFLAYSGYYYGIMIKNAPYKFAEFDHFKFEYGDGNHMINKYDSSTGEYQYLTKTDSLVKKHLHLGKNDLLYLHRKAADLGFWDFPVKEVGSKPDSAVKGVMPTHYLIEFGYKRKTKTVLFDEAFDGDPKLKDANEVLIKEILARLNDAEDAEKK